MTFHSYGEVIIYPWDYSGQVAPDHDVLNNIASNLAQRFIKDNGGSYNYYTNSALEGKCKNWFYGFGGAMAFCVELNPYPMFLPPGNQLAERTQRYYNGAIYLLERMSGPGITGHITDANTGAPLPARVEIQGRISPQVKPRFAEPVFGRYTRMLNNGAYTVLAGMRGYQYVRVEDVVVSDTLTVLDIELPPLTDEDAMGFAAGFSLDSESAIPNSVTLYSVNPNPFNPSTDIRFELRDASFVNLTVYDITGGEVVKLVDGYQSAGSHSVVFDGSDLPSGMYFLRLVVDGGQSMARKVVLVK